MSRVFLSHTGSDDSLASEIGRWLTERGHEVFLDHDLDHGVVVGEEWERRLHERLRWADAVVCIVSPDYVSSTWCSAEVGAARSRGARILPLSAQSGSIHPLLGFVHHTDLSKSREAARRYLEEALRRIDLAGGLGWPDDRSPFPGLRPFEVDMHQAFFGRSLEIQALLELLRSPAQRAEQELILLVGPSGCGKSSMLRAGLLPAIAEEPGWSALPPILPGVEPLTALTRELAHASRRVGLGWSMAQVRAQLDETGLSDLADELLLAEGEGKVRRLLVAFDQFDEMVTIAGPSERQRLVEVLKPALSGPVQLVATLRPEFLETLLSDPTMGQLPTRVVPVRPLTREAIPAVIMGPARLARIAVDESLVARLVADTGDGQALPLLAFTLAQLAQSLPAGGEGQRHLSERTYDDLGGVRGALVRQADAALAEAVGAGNRSREEVIAGLLRLVTVDEQGRPTRRRIARESLPDASVAGLDAFVARRLLVTDTKDGEVIIDVAHEAFLSEWPPLAEAIADTTTALRSRGAVEQAAADWDGGGRSATRLWEHGQLAAALNDLGAHRHHGQVTTFRIDLTDRARTFLASSSRRDKRRRRALVSVLSSLLVVALAAALVAVVRQREARDEQRLSAARQLMSQATELLDRDPATALRLGIAAYRLHPDRQTDSALLSGLLANGYQGSLARSVGYSHLVFDESGSMMGSLSPAGEVALWRLSEAAPPEPLGSPLATWPDSPEWPPIGGSWLALSGSARLMAVEGPDVVGLWDLGDPTAPVRLDHEIPLSEGFYEAAELAFSPAGDLLAIGRPSGLSVWSLGGGAPKLLFESALEGFAGVSFLEFGLDGGLLVVGGVGSDDNLLLRWDLASPGRWKQLASPLGHPGSGDFDPGSGLYAGALSSDQVGIWRVEEPSNVPLATVRTEGNYVSAVRFSQDGTQLATATVQSGGESKLERWSLDDPRHPERLVTPETPIVNSGPLPIFEPERWAFVRGLRDIRSISQPDFWVTVSSVAAGDSETAQVWDYSDLGIPRPYGAPIAPITGEVSVLPNGHTLATTRADGSVALWNLLPEAAPKRASILDLDGANVTSLFVQPDQRILLGFGSGEFAAWDVSDLRQPQDLGPVPPDPVKFPPPRYSVPDGRPGTYSSSTGVLAVSDAQSVFLTDDAGTATVPIPRSDFDDEPDSTALVTGLSMSHDGRTLAITANDRVALFDISDWHHPRPYGRPFGSAATGNALFSPDARVLALARAPKGAAVYDISELSAPKPGEVLLPTVAARGLAFSPDGRLLLNNPVDHSILQWDVSDPSRPERIGLPLAGHQTSVGVLAFSPDKRTLVSVASGELILWDVSTPDQPRQLGPAYAVNQGRVVAAAFLSPSLVATASPDGRIVFIDLSGLVSLREHPVEVACERSGGGLSRDEWARYLPGLEYRETCP